MRIAQIAPLTESVPPRWYGGTERIVSYLTEELVRQGHNVTLFASGDSETAADLVRGCPVALRQAGSRDPVAALVLQLERVRRRADEFDVLHFHLDYLHMPMMRACAARTITTLHNRIDQPDIEALFAAFPDMPLVSLSESQRSLLRGNWTATVGNGLPPDLYPFQPEGGRGDYLAFLGRICPDKGPGRAIEIARRAGLELRIAAKIDPEWQEYFDRTVAPALRTPGVMFLGEIGEQEKRAFLGDARAVLFPIDWPEPFGLVPIEAMACGTPVIGWRMGAVPEVVDDGVTGFVVDGIDAAVAAVKKVAALDRRAVRRRFEERFTVQKMAAEYLSLYQRLASAAGGRSRVA